MSSKVIPEDRLSDLEITKSFVIPHLISEIPNQKMIQKQYIPNLPGDEIYYPVIESFDWWEENNFNNGNYDEIYYPSDIFSILHIDPYYRNLGSHWWEEDNFNNGDDDIPPLEDNFNNGGDDDIPALIPYRKFLKDLEEIDDDIFKMEELD
ncbi:hypothetical protein LCGC14_0987710 [marine sediment metagenome]|uniref:Uncharacterized protein n=1 Tax=marine sediment metagenome TaxID=412755 RepID=A0A0F9NBE8_9ZZZZ